MIRRAAGRRLARGTGLAAALAIASALAVAPAISLMALVDAPRDLYVDDDPGCGGRSPCFDSIQAAVDDARSGDAVKVLPGRYTEVVTVVDKALRIEGPGSGDASDVTDPAVHAQLLRPSAVDRPAVVIDALTRDITGTRVSGLRFLGVARAVHVIGRNTADPRPIGRPPTVGNTTVERAVIDDVLVETPIGDGLVAQRVGSLEVSRATVVGAAGAGLLVRDVQRLRVAASAFREGAEGVRLVESDPALVGGADVEIGGAEDRSVDLSGNAGLALRLENDTGTGAPTSAVGAAFNRWGTPWAPEIEARIGHRVDATQLGEVRWRPALGVPDRVTVTADPTSLQADGTSTADIRADVRDRAGQAVADGAVVVLRTDLGSLDLPGQMAEAEAAEVARTGEWGLFDSGAYGPFTGSGFLRSDQPGATLAWRFTAQALVARLGAQLDSEALVSVAVDDRPPREVALVDLTQTWQLVPLASGLGVGEHAVTLTVIAGPVAVDGLAAGRTTSAGGTSVRLRSAADVGEAIVSATAFGAGGMPEADVRVPFLPGPPAEIELTADAAELPAGGATTEIEIEVLDERGRPVVDGTEVALAAELGSIAPLAVATAGGRAQAVLTSGADLGDALVVATAGGVTGTLTLPIVPGLPASVDLVSDRSEITANSRDSTLLTARVSDRLGHAVRDGVPVRLESDLGTLEIVGGATVSGAVTALLRAGAVAGAATVSASVDGDVPGSPVEATTGVTFRAPDLRVTKTVEPVAVLVPGERVTFTITIENLGPGTVYDVVVEERLPPQLVTPTLSVSGPPMMIRPDTAFVFDIERLRPGHGGTIQIGARVDDTRKWNRRTAVTNTVGVSSETAAELSPVDNAAAVVVDVEPAAVYTVTLRAPASLPVGGATGELEVRVFDRSGKPAADGTPVSLSSDLGSVTPGLVTTRDGRALATFVSGTRSGTATVSALSLEDRGAVARIEIEPGPANALALAASRSELPIAGARAALTVTLEDQYRNPIAGEEVALTTDLGSVEPPVVTTGATGTATATLRTGVRAGSARIEARHGALLRWLPVRFLPGEPAMLELSVGRRRLSVGGNTTAWAEVTDAYGNPLEGRPVVFAFDLGDVESGMLLTDEAGRARTEVLALRTGVAPLRAVSEELSASVNLTVTEPRAYLPFGTVSRR